MTDPSAATDILWAYARVTVWICIGTVYLVSFGTICSCVAAFRGSTRWKRWGDVVTALISLPLAYRLCLAMFLGHDRWAATYLVIIPCFIGIVFGGVYVSLHSVFMRACGEKSFSR